jgi:predicted alpha-1,2-mannosidase
VLAQVANKLEYQDDYIELMERSRNYVNVFDHERGWVNGRYADGTFTDEFEASRHMPYITEGTPKHYTWYVPHDIPGLKELMGGRDEFLRKLTSLIDNREYWHGNEPSHQIPYLFNYAGRWDLTQRTVKNIMKTEYGLGPGGLSGNDDAGQMSAWYVFSSMGFYPVCPGSNEYELSSPKFNKVILNLDKNYYSGKKFVIKSTGINRDGVFSSVKLNGKKTGATLSHFDLAKGGRLTFSK